MSSDIIPILHLDKDIFRGQVVLIKEINGCDSSFIISCVLDHQIKIKSATVLITFHHSLNHYQNVGLKMNYNIKKCIDSQFIKYSNVGQHIVNSLLQQNKLSLDDIFYKIKNDIIILLEKHDSVCILFEGISHLLDLKYDIREVNIFLRNIIKFVRSNNAYIVFQCNVANEEDVTHVMANLLSHMAHTVVEVGNLSTGLSTDISGHLIVRYPYEKFKTENVSILDFKPSCYHFRLYDRGVKLFAPGVI